MSLARRLTWTIAALTTGLLLVALTPLGAMRGIRLAVHLAYDEYLELRMVDATAMYVEAARAVLHTPSSGYPELVEELTAAQREIHRFLDYQVTQPPEAPEHERTELTIANHSRGVIAGILVEAQAALRRPRDDGRAEAGPNDPIPPAIRADMQARIQSVLDDLHGLSDQTAHEITDSHDRVFQRIRRAMLVSGCLALATLAGVVVLSLIQYRGVIRPLRRLRQSVRRIAARDFTERLQVDGTDEFTEVADEFNRMAGQLDSLYRGLENKVRTTSKELARSERLASAGFLAAGVAHEINNPLNIISGYAELTLKRCESNGQTHLPPEILHALRIIREESFRCKQIIEKLLSLTRMGGGRREPIDVGRVTGEVVAMLRAVEQYQGRDVRLTVSDGPAPVVPANEAELKQVVLNLVLNALEAVSSGNGRVRVDVRHAGDAVTVAVEDNGRGMTAEILDRVFEPFFTDRRGGTEPGTGLGLSITHAIVEAHGGRIRAESDGPGRGSRFIVELPVASASGFAHADTVTA